MKIIVSRPSKGFLKTTLSLSLGVFLVLTPAQSAAEALIVLEYNGAQSVGSPEMTAIMPLFRIIIILSNMWFGLMRLCLIL